MTLTFDIDGVIAGGEYIPEWDRQPEQYAKLPLLDQKIPEYLHTLGKRFNIYLISSRSYPNALDSTRLWLNNQGVHFASLCGVVTGLHYNEKTQLVRMLKSSLHIDDDYRVVGPLGELGQLFLGGDPQWWYPWSIPERHNLKPIFNWQDLMVKLDQLYGNT